MKGALYLLKFVLEEETHLFGLFTFLVLMIYFLKTIFSENLIKSIKDYF